MNDSNYKSIGYVAKLLNLINDKNGKLNTHTIRYWEKEFKHIKPKLFSGNRRYYDDKSIEKLKEIKFLLKDKGLTISGVKKYLYNKNSLSLDLSDNNTIKAHKINFKTKIKKISKLIKDIKKIN
tara:strand:- start:194 stop:565 length:372 start_codon:yes stop_codon:yes gene_type:complete